MVGIYKITSPTGKVYIGQSWFIEQRLYRYKHYPSASYNQSVLHRSLMKYGTKNHQMDVLLQLTNDTNQLLLDYHEIRLIKEYKKAGIILLNVRDGGQSLANLEVIKSRSERRQNRVFFREALAEEKIQKERQKELEKQQRLEHIESQKFQKEQEREERWKIRREQELIERQRLKAERKLLPKPPKRINWDGVKKAQESNTGKKRSQEYKDRMSKLVLDRNYSHSEESKKKISDNKKEYFQTHQVHNKGIKLHEEGRKILSDASTSKRPVSQLNPDGTLVKDWSYIKEAAIALGIIDHHITRVCKGKRKTAGGFIWKYKD